MSDIEVDVLAGAAYTIDLVGSPIVYQVDTTSDAQYREITIQALDCFTVEIEPVPAFQINVGSDAPAVSDALSYGVSQELTLTQLRQARSNQFVGSAPTIAYDAQGRAETLTYSDGSVKTLAYDVDGRLSQSSHLKSGRTLRKSFSYDGQNRLASVGEAII